MAENVGEARILAQQRSGTDDADESVPADSNVTVADARHILGADLQRPVRIGDEDKIVASAVALGQRQTLKLRNHRFTVTPRASAPQ